MQAKSAGVSKHRKDFDAASKAFLAKKQERDAQADRRKDLWRQYEKLEQEKTDLTTQLRKAEQQLFMTVPRRVHDALVAVERLSQAQGLKGKIHGPVIELFRCAPELNTAVEVRYINRCAVSLQAGLLRFITLTDMLL